LLTFSAEIYPYRLSSLQYKYSLAIQMRIIYLYDKSRTATLDSCFKNRDDQNGEEKKPIDKQSEPIQKTTITSNCHKNRH